MVQASFEAQYAAAADACCSRTGREAFDAVQDAASRRPGAVHAGATAPTIRARAFGEALRQIAQLIKADVGLEVAFAESAAGITTSTKGPRTGQLAHAARRFRAAASPRSSRDLGDRMEDVVILTMSEFGRAVAENGNRGTDHGHGNAMMVIGGARARRQGLRPLARARAGAALRRPRPRGHHRLPRRLRRGRPRASRADRHQRGVPGCRANPAARAVLTPDSPACARCAMKGATARRRGCRFATQAGAGRSR